MFDYIYFYWVSLGKVMRVCMSCTIWVVPHTPWPKYSEVNLTIFHFCSILVIKGWKCIRFLEKQFVIDIIQKTAYLKEWRISPTSDYDICFLQTMKQISICNLLSALLSSVDSCRKQHCFRWFYFKFFCVWEKILKIFMKKKRDVRSERLGSGVLYVIFYFP